MSYISNAYMHHQTNLAAIYKTLTLGIISVLSLVLMFSWKKKRFNNWIALDWKQRLRVNVSPYLSHWCIVTFNVASWSALRRRRDSIYQLSLMPHIWLNGTEHAILTAAAQLMLVTKMQKYLNQVGLSRECHAPTCSLGIIWTNNTYNFSTM